MTTQPSPPSVPEAPVLPELERATPGQRIARVSRMLAGCREGTYHPAEVTLDDTRAGTYVYVEVVEPLLEALAAERQRADEAEALTARVTALAPVAAKVSAESQVSYVEALAALVAANAPEPRP